MRTIVEELSDNEIPAMSVEDWLERIEAAANDLDRPQVHRTALMEIWNRVDELIDETGEYEI